MERVQGAVPEAAERLSHEAVVAAVQSSVPDPLLVIWIGCAAGTVPLTVYANCRLVGVASMVELETTMMLMASSPDTVCTPIVTRPVRSAGSFAVIAWLAHEAIVKFCDVLDPDGVAVTSQPLHCS